MKSYLIFIKRYNTVTIYKTTTDNVYRVIGKICTSSIMPIHRIIYGECTQEREKFWKETGLTMHTYEEPILSED